MVLNAQPETVLKFNLCRSKFLITKATAEKTTFFVKFCHGTNFINLSAFMMMMMMILMMIIAIIANFMVMVKW